MKKDILLNKILASLMHVFSLLLTFVLPVLVYLGTRKKNQYFADHAKEGMNLHFTFFPILLLLQVMNMKPIFTYTLLSLETILIIFATIYALQGKKFAYPVIRYFKV